MLNQGSTPHTGSQIGEFHERAVRVEDQVKVRGQQGRGNSGIDRTLVMGVVATWNHHNWHPGARDLVHREMKCFVADAIRTEKVANDQQQIGAIAVGNIDHFSTRTPNSIAETVAPWARAEGVTLKVNVGGVHQLKLSRNNSSHSHLRQGRCRNSSWPDL